MQKNFLLTNLYFRHFLISLILYCTLVYFYSHQYYMTAEEKSRFELELMLERASQSYKKKEYTDDELIRRYSEFSPKFSPEEANSMTRESFLHYKFPTQSFSFFRKHFKKKAKSTSASSSNTSKFT